MESVQEMYRETVSRWSSDDQLLLAALILEGVRKAKNKSKRDPQRTSMLEILKEVPGEHLFKTSAEADAYLREERDSWDR